MKETNAPEEDGKGSSLLTLGTRGFSRVFGLRRKMCRKLLIAREKKPLVPRVLPSRLACEQALLFGRVKRVSRERASERAAPRPRQASCQHEELSSIVMNSNGTELNKSFTHNQHRARAVDQEGFVNQIPVFPPNIYFRFS